MRFNCQVTRRCEGFAYHYDQMCDGRWSATMTQDGWHGTASRYGYATLEEAIREFEEEWLK